MQVSSPKIRVFKPKNDLKAQEKPLSNLFFGIVSLAMRNLVGY